MLWLYPSIAIRMVSSQPASWSGDMHPETGFAQSGCNATTLVGCAPGYEALNASGKLWSCPDGVPSSDSCPAAAGGCVHGTGAGNPTCGGLNASSPCCCPADGC